jgi:tartrate-resistant acid phosphatase type 5
MHARMKGRMSLGRLGVLLLLLFSPGAAGPASPKPAQIPGLSLHLLPAELQERGAEILGEKDDDQRAKLAGALAEDRPSQAKVFLIALLERDPSRKVRLAIIEDLGSHSDPIVRRALERHAASDPDVDVAILSVERLRETSAADQRRLIARRLALAKKQRDTKATQALEAEEERWISVVNGTMLPGFLRKPPDLFSVKKAGAMRVLAFGDFGDGSEAQRTTALAMREAAREKPFDFGITLGDNFYKEGMASPIEPRWRSWWADLYGPLGIRFYAVMGNHDWKLPDSPAAEILHADANDGWSMPSPYYTFRAGPSQFFALDTNDVSEAQLAWLDHELGQSTARWKIVFGHHPIYSAGHHGDTRRLIVKLLPLLRNRADVYLCGHDHDLQHLQEDSGVHFFVAGGGGAETRPLHSDSRTIFGEAAHGFAILEADENTLTVQFVGADSTVLHTSTIRKP